MEGMFGMGSELSQWRLSFVAIWGPASPEKAVAAVFTHECKFALLRSLLAFN